MPTGKNMPSANITHSQSESIAVSSHQCHRPLRRSARTELMREAREIRRRTRKVGKPTQKPPPARRNAQKCEKLQKVPRQRWAARKDQRGAARKERGSSKG